MIRRLLFAFLDRLSAAEDRATADLIREDSEVRATHRIKAERLHRHNTEAMKQFGPDDEGGT